MENASKALIVAGSILIAIMIVALGVSIFNKAKNSADTSGLEQQEILTFNKQWEKYEGSQLGSNVKNLISTAVSNASVNKDEPLKLPKINGVSDATSIGNLRSGIVSTATYTVTLTYSADGLITEINF